MKSYCTQFTDRECREEDCCLVLIDEEFVHISREDHDFAIKPNHSAEDA